MSGFPKILLVLKPCYFRVSRNNTALGTESAVGEHLPKSSAVHAGAEGSVKNSGEGGFERY